MRQTLTDHKPPFRSPPPDRQAIGTLQDAGELAVLTPNQGTVRHQFALVVAFESESQLRQAIDEHGCRYRPGKRIEELTHE